MEQYPVWKKHVKFVRCVFQVWVYHYHCVKSSRIPPPPPPVAAAEMEVYCNANTSHSSLMTRHPSLTAKAHPATIPSRKTFPIVLQQQTMMIQWMISEYNIYDIPWFRTFWPPFLAIVPLLIELSFPFLSFPFSQQPIDWLKSDDAELGICSELVTCKVYGSIIMKYLFFNELCVLWCSQLLVCCRQSKAMRCVTWRDVTIIYDLLLLVSYSFRGRYGSRN